MIGSVLPWQQAYMQKVVDTVNDLQNVLYEPCKEAPDDTWCRNMINAIHAYQNTKPNQHPVLYPALNGLPSDSAEINSNADLFAGSSRIINGVNPCGTGTPTCKVNLNDSDHSYTMPGVKTDGALLNRNFVWENFVSGAGGIMFQDPYLMFWSANSRNLCDNGVPPPHGQCTTVDPYWEPLRNSLGYATLLSQKLDLVKMSPSSLASTSWCLANDSAVGGEFVVYAPNGGSFTVDLSAQAGRTLNYQWLDPTTGTYSSIATVSGGNSTQSFTPPWGSSYDAVLYIVDAAGHN
jgi:Putative collagen-binding domain of a collagenase